MSILYLMIPMGILIVIGAVWAFFWAVNSGQFDDLDSPAWRILLDDDSRPPASGEAPDAAGPDPEEKEP
ncbi:cbb3-type cytochrome oxidase assembly protein CcoS [Thioalkalivibrio sp. XN8]|uniref:cbb3-type cytochrome oxidase assembly protein CcoS n=1 Tax=Thioalkalivibrio sp. XN8 TaxID=2712863 RepID=UPI0013EB93F7|nr:cbb3-type cytochrome oxidase assembly protein CcoS [Thioalkalivibrio sp. XN8]NGP54227.1 cbb3-type cytochrome oxidase assembly protein CcoS [Thioalkalivibrio sp. XN8]